MNIFVLHADAAQAALPAVDRHVVKMVLETAQILSTALHRHGLEAPYRPSHKGHPCVVWAGDTAANFGWLVQHGLALGAEYEYRYGRVHGSLPAIQACRRQIPLLHLAIAKSGRQDPTEFTDWPQAMPDDSKVPGDAVAAYRRYYNLHKRHLHRWTKRNVPEWIGVDR